MNDITKKELQEIQEQLESIMQYGLADKLQNIIDDNSIPVDKPVGVPSRTNSETLLECNMENKYSIEPHGDGYAIYYGRCMHRHGYNLAHLTECEEKFVKIIEEALNEKSVKP